LTTYFGVVNSDGSDITGTPGSDSDTTCLDWINESFTCPGSGNQNIQEISVKCYPNGGCNIRCGIYSSDGSTLIAEGTGEVALTGTTYAWQGHMSQAAVKAAGGSSPGVLVGGTTYRLAWTQDGAWLADYYLGVGGIHYTSSSDNTAGMPANAQSGTIWTGGQHFIRVGVSPAASTVTISETLSFSEALD
jgi:hypothetical protein